MWLGARSYIFDDKNLLFQLLLYREHTEITNDMVLDQLESFRSIVDKLESISKSLIYYLNFKRLSMLQDIDVIKILEYTSKKPK